MKKTLVAMAVLAASGAAMAQSSVTLFGVLDAGIGHYTADGQAGVTKIESSGLSSSRLGFKGVEDLGGGSYADFWLEAGITPGSGAGAATNTSNTSAGATTGNGLTFNRRSTVGLGGSWGELRIGRDYTPDVVSKLIFDPFGANGVGEALNLSINSGGSASVRASNGVSYLYGFDQNSYPFTGNNVYFQGTVAKGGTAGTSDGDYQGARLGYAAGPVNVAVATGQTKLASVGNAKTNNIGASYDFGVASLILAYNTNKNGNNSLNNKETTVGTAIPVGAGTFKLAYNHISGTGTGDSGSATQFSAGYVYALSKRSSLYTTFATLSNSGGGKFTFAANSPYYAGAPTANGKTQGFEVGFKQSF